MNGTNANVEFNLSFAPGVTDEQILGFELAGEMWSQYLGDTHTKIEEGKDFKVNIHVEIADNLLPNNVLGGAFPAIETGKRYKDFHKAIVNDVSTLNDQKVVDNLLDTDKVDILVGDRIVGNDHMHMTRANLKALNIIKADDNKLDGYIVINNLSNVNSVEWNYDYLGGAKPGTVDFLSTATHEIGHVLGFISGTDRSKLPTQLIQQYAQSSSNNIIQQAISIQNTGYYQEFNSGNSVEFKGYYQQQDLQRVTDAIQTLQNLEDYNSRDQARQALNTINDFLKRDNDLERVIRDDDDFKDVLDGLAKIQDSQSYAKYMTSMDLFRYSAESANLGINDLSVGNDAYFSLDGSQTNLGLSKGTSYDYQGSHWENRDIGNGLGVMNPTIALNERWKISQNDLLVMDAIGWDVVSPGEVDSETLYEAAELQVQTALIEDRNEDVATLLNNEAYNWARRSSTGSSGSFWQEGYFSTFNVEEVADKAKSITDESSACDSNCPEDNHNENNFVVPENIVPETIFYPNKSDRSSQDSSNKDVSQQNEKDNVSTLNQNNNNNTLTQESNDNSQLLLDNSLVDNLVSELGESLETL